MKSYTQFIKESENEWDLYSGHPGHGKAHKELNDAWENAKTRGSAKEAERHMVKTMTKHKKVGALDTEPRHILHKKLKKHFPDYSRRNYHDKDSHGDYLGSVF